MRPRRSAATDDAGRIVKAVEEFLTDVCHVGITGRVVIHEHPTGLDHRGEGGDNHQRRVQLVYRRFDEDGKFRIFIDENEMHYEDAGYDDERAIETLWHNCPRDLKLQSYEKLPELLDLLIQQVEQRVERTRISTAAINGIMELLPASKKGAKR